MNDADKFHKLSQITDCVSLVWSVMHYPLFDYIL